MSIGDAGESSSSSSSSRSSFTSISIQQKDPRTIARRYQLDLCKKALEENIIVYLGTGCGKTHIAVLLIYEMGHLIRNPQRNICIFLAPTVALVEQQAKVIEDSLGFKVMTCYGNSKNLKGHHDWEKKIEEYEVLVMTPQILLYSLQHCFIRMDLIALLIFDECHHAQIKSNHPYAEIMKVFYNLEDTSRPRIFGMTASPVIGKDASNPSNLSKCINSLENLLDAKVYTVDDTEELENFVASPKVKVYYFGPVSNSETNTYVTYYQKLEEIKSQSMSLLSQIQKTSDNLKSLLAIKKALRRMHDNLIFCLDNLGLCGALQACKMLLSGSISERNELIEADIISSDNTICDNYLTKSACVFSSDCTRDGIGSDISDMGVLKEPFFSKKMLRLIGILSKFRLLPNMKCIIFVNRVVIARCLSYILQNLKFLASWRCHFLVGLHSGLKNASRKFMNNIVNKFRSDEFNLLVATKVGEEGLDIQTCCLVIRFDLPETVASFIQSRGRARMPQSEYAFLVDSGNQRELDIIENFKHDEERMNKEISCRTSNESFFESEEKVYKVESSGACITAGYSVSWLHKFCSTLSHDEYFDPKPEFFFIDDVEGTVCHIVLPSNAPVHQVVSQPQSSIEAAKKDACLKACKELHEKGALNDYLLPNNDSVISEEIVLASSDSDKGDSSRGELCEMLVPSILKGPCPSLKKHVYLNAYYLKFSPIPGDRDYNKFGLFVKAPLPEEAENLEVDLHLSRRRSVMTKLVPSGLIKFSSEQILEAQRFQEMFLTVILQRSLLVPDFITLGKKDISQSNTSTFYFMLPIILLEEENTLIVDWKVIVRCISSPIFTAPVSCEVSNPLDAKLQRLNGIKSASDIIPLGNQLQLANGLWSTIDIVDSLVYVPHRDAFFFVSAVLNKNGYSQYKESTSFEEQYMHMHDIRLSHPQQPLLKAKQLFSLQNLLHDRKNGSSDIPQLYVRFEISVRGQVSLTSISKLAAMEDVKDILISLCSCNYSRELEEHFFELPPELCQLKILGFSKEIGSSISLLPSLMHRLENLLVAIELKHVLSASFSEGSEVTAHRVLEALTTERCSERFSLERLEVLGDAFLKYAVGRHLFLSNEGLDEGELTRKRSRAVDNSNLYNLATRKKLQIYIRDQPFDPTQFFAYGRPCSVICDEGNESKIHFQYEGIVSSQVSTEVKCSKGHHWLHKKTIADMVEALVGAFLIDSGFKAATALLGWFGIQVDFEASQVTGACKGSMRYLQLKESTDLPVLESLLGYRFIHRGLLLQAVVHPSYNLHGGGCYQRLEFLGDAVMDYLITSYLYTVYPNLTPGQMTDLRSVCVNNKAFANVAVLRSLYKFLISDSNALSMAIDEYVKFVKTCKPEETGLDEPKCPKVLGDLVESCMGAILLDTGFDLNIMWKIMLSVLDPVMTFVCLQVSPIRDLLELCQCNDWNHHFSSSKSGKLFSIEAKVTGKDVNATVFVANLNKKDATMNAARQLCKQLKARGFVSKKISLEGVLKNTIKMEAKLIGFDEIPFLVPVPDTIQMENSTSLVKCNEPTLISAPCIRRISTDRDLPSSANPVLRQPSGEVKENFHEHQMQCSGDAKKGSARSLLYQVCAANYWKAPTFECCKEEGPSHLKLYSFKVTVEIVEASNMTVECFGSPSPKKKAAAERAAEGAIWYLRKQAYIPQDKGISDT